MGARTIVCRSYFNAQDDFTGFLHWMEHWRMCVSSTGCKKIKYWKWFFKWINEHYLTLHICYWSHLILSDLKETCVVSVIIRVPVIIRVAVLFEALQIIFPDLVFFMIISRLSRKRIKKKIRKKFFLCPFWAQSENCRLSEIGHVGGCDWLRSIKKAFLECRVLYLQIPPFSDGVLGRFFLLSW